MELEISPLLSGKATMLVYYVTESLEFISDFIKFNVDECFQNEVGDRFYCENWRINLRNVIKDDCLHLALDNSSSR